MSYLFCCYWYVVVFCYCCFNWCFMAWRLISRACLRVRGVLAWPLSFMLFNLFVVPRSGSGARGLIKAPGGVRGRAPGGVRLFGCSDSLCNRYIAPPRSGGVGGGKHRSLLDIPVRTDTEGVGLRGFRGVPLYGSLNRGL